MSDTRPIYQQLAGGIRDMIISGELPEGERAPSTNELSAFHSVNPTTSAKALTVLFEEGLLESGAAWACLYAKARATRSATNAKKP